MMYNLHRDEATVPIVKHLFAGFRSYLSGARDVLMHGRRGRGRARRRAQAAISHALTFTTWRSLTLEQGLNDPEAAELMRRLIAATADGSNKSPKRAAPKSPAF